MNNESSSYHAHPPEDEHQQTTTVSIDATTEFQRSLRDLSKRYRSVRSDLQVVMQQLEAGNFLGDRMVGLGEGCVVFKVRVRNRDIQKGKSAGYRLIYQVESPTSLLLLTIYSKSDRSDITANEVRDIVGSVYRDD
ncbi:type II toxin-antitoxin system RelE/ParE family toxin [Nodosilinea sp. LEGE 07088]|uniref:type II toxin-antitoxin system RelE family toxin n=1 Tax=Nodosilinea sp. LEGE 07088 TaxID=2777968 RepID=UPI001D1471A8|nr:type II toxin-antitoxin system RelE/ParE family toxin [Nodosilinea sp. LEGE 07088]